MQTIIFYKEGIESDHALHGYKKWLLTMSNNNSETWKVNLQS